MKVKILKGGPGSGHHGHSGRPGHRGGSLPGSGVLGADFYNLSREDVEERLVQLWRDKKISREEILQLTESWEQHTEQNTREITTEQAIGLIGENSPINLDLRKGRSLDEDSRKIVDALDAGMEPLDKDTILYRGLTIRDAQTAKAIFGSEKLSVGDTFTDPGYMSTSESIKIAGRFTNTDTIIKIRAQAGQSTLNVAGRGSHLEDEHLLPRGTTLRLIGTSDGLQEYEIVSSGISKESTILEQAKQLVDEEFDAAEQTILQRWQNHVDTTKLKQLPIDDQSKQNLLNIRLRIFYDESDALTERMFTGDVTLGDFQEQFKGLIREFHTSSAAIGKGGWDNMSSRDWGRLGTPLREQYKWLQGFVDYIDENRDTISLAQIRSRARLYGDGAIRAAILTEAGFTIAELLPFLPKDGSTTCLNRCHCRWVLTVTGTQGNFQIVRAVWELGVADHCEATETKDGCKDREGYTEVIRVPIDVEVPSVIGGY